MDRWLKVAFTVMAIPLVVAAITFFVMFVSPHESPRVFSETITITSQIPTADPPVLISSSGSYLIAIPEYDYHKHYAGERVTINYTLNDGVKTIISMERAK